MHAPSSVPSNLPACFRLVCVHLVKILNARAWKVLALTPSAAGPMCLIRRCLICEAAFFVKVTKVMLCGPTCSTCSLEGVCTLPQAWWSCQSQHLHTQACLHCHCQLPQQHGSSACLKHTVSCKTKTASGFALSPGVSWRSWDRKITCHYRKGIVDACMGGRHLLLSELQWWCRCDCLDFSPRSSKSITQACFRGPWCCWRCSSGAEAFLLFCLAGIAARLRLGQCSVKLAAFRRFGAI